MYYGDLNRANKILKNVYQRSRATKTFGSVESDQYITAE